MNGSQSVSQTFALFFSPRFSHYRGAWNRLISREVVAKNFRSTIPKCNMGYNQYTVPNVLHLSNLLLLLSFSFRKQTSMGSRAILSNFFEEQ